MEIGAHHEGTGHGIMRHSLYSLQDGEEVTVYVREKQRIFYVDGDFATSSSCEAMWSCPVHFWSPTFTGRHHYGRADYR